MSVTCVMVESLDGYITNGDRPGTAWASEEDQVFFREQIAAADSLVMGRSTYEVAKGGMQPDPEKPRIVISHFPELYDDLEVPGLEFTDLAPKAIIAGLIKRGFNRTLLVGGAEANAAFLEDGAVDEMIVTVEPVLLGSGRPLVGKLKKPVPMKLLSVTKLNERGTEVKRYRVIKDDEPA